MEEDGGKGVRCCAKRATHLRIASPDPDRADRASTLFIPATDLGRHTGQHYFCAHRPPVIETAIVNRLSIFRLLCGSALSTEDVSRQCQDTHLPSPPSPVTPSSFLLDVHYIILGIHASNYHIGLDGGVKKTGRGRRPCLGERHYRYFKAQQFLTQHSIEYLSVDTPLCSRLILLDTMH